MSQTTEDGVAISSFDCRAGSRLADFVGSAGGSVKPMLLQPLPSVVPGWQYCPRNHLTKSVLIWTAPGSFSRIAQRTSVVSGNLGGLVAVGAAGTFLTLLQRSVSSATSRLNVSCAMPAMAPRYEFGVASMLTGS